MVWYGSVVWYGTVCYRVVLILMLIMRIYKAAVNMLITGAVHSQYTQYNTHQENVKINNGGKIVALV